MHFIFVRKLPSTKYTKITEFPTKTVLFTSLVWLLCAVRSVTCLTCIFCLGGLQALTISVETRSSVSLSDIGSSPRLPRCGELMRSRSQRYVPSSPTSPVSASLSVIDFSDTSFEPDRHPPLEVRHQLSVEKGKHKERNMRVKNYADGPTSPLRCDTRASSALPKGLTCTD